MCIYIYISIFKNIYISYLHTTYIHIYILIYHLYIYTYFYLYIIYIYIYISDGIHIPKEKDSRKIEQFRPISFLNIEGKIFFGVIAKRMTRFMINNGYVSTSIQKAGIDCFPGCIEHITMLWDQIKTVKNNKTELHVIWLDLENVYGSVRH